MCDAYFKLNLFWYFENDGSKTLFLQKKNYFCLAESCYVLLARNSNIQLKFYIFLKIFIRKDKMMKTKISRWNSENCIISFTYFSFQSEYRKLKRKQNKSHTNINTQTTAVHLPHIQRQLKKKQKNEKKIINNI